MVQSDERVRGRVIVTYARSYQALTAIRSLGRRGIEVIAGDEYSLLTLGGLSRYATDTFEYPSPSTDPNGFLDALDEAIDAHRPPADVPYVLMPVHRETSLVARERARFEDRIRIPLASYDVMRLVQHKSRLARYAEEVGVPIPRTIFPTNEEELERMARDLRYPLFIKPPTGASGTGLHRVDDERELREAFRDLLEDHDPAPEDYPLVQEAAEGHDYCVTTLFDQGRLRACMTYRNVLTWPKQGGNGVVRETVDAPAAETLAERLLGGLGWHGIAQVDFRWTGREGDTPRLLEINPRFFGGLFQSVASGVDYPWLLFQVAAGWDVERPVPHGVRTETPVTGIIATLREIAADETSMERLQRAWDDAREEVLSGHGWRGARSILRGLRKTLDVEARIDHARKLLQENEENVSVLFDQPDDPLPLLGLMFPLAVFLRHGTIRHDMLISADVHPPDA